LNLNIVLIKNTQRIVSRRHTKGIELLESNRKVQFKGFTCLCVGHYRVTSVWYALLLIHARRRVTYSAFDLHFDLDRTARLRHILTTQESYSRLNRVGINR